MPAVSRTGGVVSVRGEMESSPRRATRWTILAHGQQSLWLRAESLVILAGTLWLYGQYGGGWLLFALFFAVPDLSLLTGVVSRYAAVAVYNVAHSYVVGVGLAVVGFHISGRLVLALALAWIAHISFDRSIGLAYPMSVHPGTRAVHRQEHQGGLI